jgi:hypothetical protein
VQQDLRGWNCRGKKNLTGNEWVTIVYVSDDANAASSFDKSKTIVLSCKHHQNRDRILFFLIFKKIKNQRKKTTITTQFIMLRQSWNHDLKNKNKSERQRHTQREQKRRELRAH